MGEIKEEYGRLARLPPDADRAAKQRRGYDFERLLNALFLVERLDPRTSFKPDGEQIDGSIHLDGRIYLVEAKWHAEPLPASTLYQFKGKVDGKLAGTIGLFISMSGYAEQAVDALVLGKALNIVLFDRRDMDAAINRRSGFANILKLKLRKAAEEGVIYFPTEGELVTAEKSQVVEIDDLPFDQASGGAPRPRPTEVPATDLLIVCEGETDRVVLATLAERILRDEGSSRSIKIVVAMGKVTIPSVANAVHSSLRPQTRMLIVLDGDNDVARTTELLQKGLQFADWISIVPNPSIEVWLDVDPSASRKRSAQSRIETARQVAERLDISALRAKDEQFAKFYGAILGA
ncbi:TOPRIM nucleotidyl transferase/hydrolase domain-containing protein [Mesorhizobium sp.]|uniref:restriction endonuclease n=1 Tax=Mesorhizobium sp. TaxID=1871066 RepID=UPI0025FB7D05|nr:TOPRIM nucleotidyl transferase/hydrolase domain-containing protein [Mesorhizobium sp.]